MVHHFLDYVILTLGILVGVANTSRHHVTAKTKSKTLKADKAVLTKFNIKHGDAEVDKTSRYLHTVYEN